MSTTGWVATIIAVLIIIGGAWWYMSSQAPAAPATTNTTAVTNSTDTTGTPTASSTGTVAPLTQTIHYTASGFTPQSVTIANGGTVTWVNDSTGQMWVASDEHPTHTDYDSTSRTTHCAAGYTGPKPFDECAAGSTYSFTFSKAGAYTFHNHAAAQFKGTVTVEAAR